MNLRIQTMKHEIILKGLWHPSFLIKIDVSPELVINEGSERQYQLIFYGSS